MSSRKLHIAVGVICDDRQQALLSLRPAAADQGGLWEFPGGKVEAGESIEEALARELHEELGIELRQSEPLIVVNHQYPQYDVQLDVRRVLSWQGEIHGREDQAIKWVAVEQLHEYPFPAANVPIIRALQLPSLYAITPDLQARDVDRFLEQLELCLKSGMKLLQLRCLNLPRKQHGELIRVVADHCHRHQARLLINSRHAGYLEHPVDGIHLTSHHLLQLTERPLGPEYLVVASCHNRAEVEHANRLGLDFIVAAPVMATKSHMGASLLGWDGLQHLCMHANMPVFALGGMQAESLSQARQAGAQGVAMIGGVWNAPDPTNIIRGC